MNSEVLSHEKIDFHPSFPGADHRHLDRLQQRIYLRKRQRKAADRHHYFPEYDWVREILGERADHVELTMFLDDGVDIHSFQPTADDMVTISNCDLFLYTGGESDTWVEDALSNATNPDLVAMNLMEVVGDGVKAEEVVEGMQESEHHHHHEEEENPEDTHEHHEEHDHERDHAHHEDCDDPS